MDPTGFQRWTAHPVSATSHVARMILRRNNAETGIHDVYADGRVDPPLSPEEEEGRSVMIANATNARANAT